MAAWKDVFCLLSGSVETLKGSNAYVPTHYIALLHERQNITRFLVNSLLPVDQKTI